MTTPTRVLFVGLPCYGGNVQLLTMLALFELKEVLTKKRKLPMVIYGVPNCSTISLARDACAHAMMKLDGRIENGGLLAEDLLFVDADIGFRSDAIEKLLDSPEGIAAISCPKKELSYKNIVAVGRSGMKIPLEEAGADFVFAARVGENERELKMDADGWLEVRSAGTGIMRIKRDVFVQMKERHPDLYYRSGASLDTRGEIIHAYFMPTLTDEKEGRDDVMLRHFDTEDYAFCRRWRNMGGKVVVWPDATVSHTGTHTFRGNLRRALEIGGVLAPLRR